MSGTGKPRLFALALALALLAGCAAPAPRQTQLFAMDTVMTLTLYDGQEEQALEAASELIERLENALSVTREGSVTDAINHAGGAWVDVDEADVFSLIVSSLSLCEQTQGALDVTAFPAVSAWGFTTGDYRVPTADELETLASKIDYRQIETDADGGASRVRLSAEMALDFGAVAKGFAGDQLCALLKEQGVSCAILDLGGNIQTLGTKPDGSLWRVGIRDPQGDGYLGVVQLGEGAVVTSGGYQRYFEQAGARYWHIIDPETAAPARSGLLSVTVVGESGLVCDGLSTALFVMGLDKAAAFLRENPQLGVQAIFVSENGLVSVTRGLEGRFTLMEDYPYGGVTVLE
jgi:thiamine biosynthesis lipoprotein